MARVSKVGMPGIIEVTLDGSRPIERSMRFRGQPPIGGVCVIVARDRGLALDVGWDQRAGWSPWLWPMHGLEPQQWIVKRYRRSNRYSIAHGVSGLVLTAPRGKGHRPTIERLGDSDRQLWELASTDDQSAFLLRSPPSGFVLDATENAAANDHPVVWSENWNVWQQWVVARLPVKTPRRRASS